MQKVFWVTASKGGTGKTLFSMMLHASCYAKRVFDPKKILLLDLNSQNRDLYNIISRSISGKPITMEISSNGKRLRFSIIHADYGPVIATVDGVLELQDFLFAPLTLVEKFDFLDAIIVDTNLNLSSFSLMDPRSIAKINSYVSELEIYPIFFYIWSIGSITRYALLSNSGKVFEIESILQAIKNLANSFGSSEEVFSQKNLIVTINTSLWLYNTITLLKAILTELNAKYIQALLSRENIGFYTFSRLTKDIIVRAIRPVADTIVATSGTKPKFRYIEVFFALSLYHILFGESKKLLDKLGKTRIYEELNVLVDKLQTIQIAETIPINMLVIPPTDDIHNTQALIHSAQLLTKNDIELLLSDPNADNLPYRTIRKSAETLGNYLRLLRELLRI